MSGRCVCPKRIVCNVLQMFAWSTDTVNCALILLALVHVYFPTSTVPVAADAIVAVARRRPSMKPIAVRNYYSRMAVMVASGSAVRKKRGDRTQQKKREKRREHKQNTKKGWVKACTGLRPAQLVMTGRETQNDAGGNARQMHTSMYRRRSNSAGKRGYYALGSISDDGRRCRYFCCGGIFQITKANNVKATRERVECFHQL